MHLLRFLMVEVSEACHTASVLSNGPGETEDGDGRGGENDDVEVEVEEQGKTGESCLAKWTCMQGMLTGTKCSSCRRGFNLNAKHDGTGPWCSCRTS